MDSTVECSLDLSVNKRKLEDSIDESLEDGETPVAELKKRTQNNNTTNLNNSQNNTLNGLSKVDEDDMFDDDLEDGVMNKENDEVPNEDHLTNGKIANVKDEIEVSPVKEENNDDVDKEADDELMPSIKEKELTADEIEERDNLHKLLNGKLAIEEAKLMLIKKIQLSQIKETQQQIQAQQQNKLQQQQANVTNLVNQNLRNHVHLSRPLNPQQQQQSQLSSHLLANNLNNLSQLRNQRGSQQQLSRVVNQLNFAGQSLMNGLPGKNNINNGLGRNSPHLQVNNNVLKRNSANSLVNSNNIQNMLGLQNQLNRVLNNSSPSPSTQKTNKSPAQNNSAINQPEFLTPAQQQAAKQALQKQIEKVLTSIQNPKPIKDEINFIPNAQNNEFIYYFGLETVVDFLTNSNDENKNKDNSTNGTSNENSPPQSKDQTKEPLICSQCGTDFSPTWKFKELTTAEKRKQKDRKLKDEKQTLAESNGEMNG